MGNSIFNSCAKCLVLTFNIYKEIFLNYFQGIQAFSNHSAFIIHHQITSSKFQMTRQVSSFDFTETASYLESVKKN